MSRTTLFLLLILATLISLYNIKLLIDTKNNLYEEKKLAEEKINITYNINELKNLLFNINEKELLLYTIGIDRNICNYKNRVLNCTNLNKFEFRNLESFILNKPIAIKYLLIKKNNSNLNMKVEFK